MTPDWNQQTMFGCMSPRDVLMTIGPEILEATMSYRSRWFEYLSYRPLIERYYREDTQMRWEAAPKPRLTAVSYKNGFWDEFEELTDADRAWRASEGDLLLTEAEPLFDAADIARVGKDLFVQISTVTNYSGVRWLRQHFRGHRVHEVTFADPHPLHIDTTWVPLRPGLVLHNSERIASRELLMYFKLNDWEVVEAARPRRAPSELPPLCFCSPWLAMNVLCLDPGTVCVEASEVYLADQLTMYGFEVVPVPFWDVAPFGGGLHCATVDLLREGGQEDYFPHRHGEF
jgi:glycine amidinotransferase